MQKHRVRHLLMGGQACVLYGAAESSRDADLAILSGPDNLARLDAALGELQASCIAVPPFSQEHLDIGLAVHFRCKHPEALNIRIDVMSKMRGVDDFDKLWAHRTTIESGDGRIELLSLPDLVKAKKTQRDRDWPMVARLLESSYLPNREHPTEEQIEFWLCELRTPSLLQEVASRFPAQPGTGSRLLAAQGLLWPRRSRVVPALRDGSSSSRSAETTALAAAPCRGRAFPRGGESRGSGLRRDFGFQGLADLFSGFHISAGNLPQSVPRRNMKTAGKRIARRATRPPKASRASFFFRRNCVGRDVLLWDRRLACHDRAHRKRREDGCPTMLAAAGGRGRRIPLRHCFVVALAAIVAYPFAEGEEVPPPQGPFAGRPIVLARQKKAAATIVHGKATKELAGELKTELRKLTRVRFPIASDAAVVEEGRFDYRENWRDKTLIIVGNVSSNRAFLGLYARFLVGVNRAYPGPGRYVLRTLLEPLRQGADIVVVGGSDEAGLRAGINRAAAAIASSTDEKGNCHLRPLIEVGDAEGKIADSFGYHGNTLGAFYWGSNLKAGLGRKQAVLKSLTEDSKDLKQWGGSHYTWETRYRELLKMLAAGFFDEGQVVEIQNRMYESLAATEDAWGKRAISVPPAEWNRRMTRHTLTGFTGQLLLGDYLRHVAELDTEKAQTVAKCYENLKGILTEIARSRRYRSGIEGREAIDVLGNLANVLFYLGDESALRSDIYRNMAAYRLATRDNLGRHAGVDSYIGCRSGHQFNPTPSAGPAAHLGAWLLRDPELLGITELDEERAPVTYLGVLFPPEFAKPDPELKPEVPAAFTGVQVLPLDGFFEGFTQSFPATSDSFVKYDAGNGRAFDKAVFRDGFESQDAYLLLQGLNVSTPMYREGIFGNAIIRYTELGSLFLFSNTQIVGSWARSVVQISRGDHDPQSTASLNLGSFRGTQVSAVQSLQEQNGGASWTRTILRRHNGYFIVIDKVVAHHDADYNVSCQWRSYHHGKFRGPRRFVATDMMNGAQMHIVAARHHETGLVQQARDGAADPLMVRQFQDRSMVKGEAVAFGNLIYATGPGAAREFEVREIAPGSVAVRGKADGFEELSLVSTHGIQGLADIDTDARIAYVANDSFCAISATQVQRASLKVQSEARFSLEVVSEKRGLTVENPTEGNISVRVTAEGKGREVTVPPGKVEVDLKGDFLPAGEIGKALTTLWKDAESESSSRTPSPGIAQAPPMEAAWQQKVFQTPPRPYHGFELKVESPAPVEAKILVDRDHHRWSQRANFPGTGDWQMEIQLAETVEVESIRLVGYRSARLFPEGLSFDLLIEGEDGPRKVPNVAPIGEFWYSEGEKYLMVAGHPSLRIPINARALKVILRARKNGEAKARYAFQEARVFVRDPAWRAKSSLHRIREADQDALIAVGPRSVERLNSSGKTVWTRKADTRILHHFVECSRVEKRWLIGFWPASQRFTLLDSGGNVVVAPTAFETKENSRLLSGYARPHALTLWEREAGKPASVAFFPHYSFGEIRRDGGAVKAEIGEGRGGKAVLRMPDITGDGREDLFVVGRYENNNGILPSQREDGKEPSSLAGQHWTGNRISNWTGWSAGNMELTMYHDASLVSKAEAGKREWLGVVAVNPGGLDFYRQPSFERTWGHLNHPGNLCLAVGDITGDGTDEILLGREDGFLVAYSALSGEQVLKVNLHHEIRAVVVTGAGIAVGTSKALFSLDTNGLPVARAGGAVESLALIAAPNGQESMVAAFSDGSIKAFRLP